MMLSRRAWLQSNLSLGTLAAAYLLHADGLLGTADASPGGMDLRPRTGHVPARATSVIFLMQSGGPSQVDLFDPKPELNRQGGKKPGTGFVNDVDAAKTGTWLGSPFKFVKRGRSDSTQRGR